MRPTHEPSFGGVHGVHHPLLRRRAAWSSAFALLAACALEPDASVITAVQFQDVVVPSGLRLREGAGESWSREEASWRDGHFEYAGQADVQAAADYVRERMPQHNWTKTQDESVADVGLRMRFERGIYRALYTFSRSEGVTIMVVDYKTDLERR
jgi:hypothetical protein